MARVGVDDQLVDRAGGPTPAMQQHVCRHRFAGRDVARGVVAAYEDGAPVDRHLVITDLGYVGARIAEQREDAVDLFGQPCSPRGDVGDVEARVAAGIEVRLDLGLERLRLVG